MVPALDNPRHEQYAQARAIGHGKAVSYEEAGYAVNDNTRRANSTRLEKQPEVAERIKQLQNAGAEKTSVDVAWLVEKGKELIEGAKNDGQFTAAVSGLEKVAKIAGHWTDKTDNTNRESWLPLLEDDD